MNLFFPAGTSGLSSAILLFCTASLCGYWVKIEICRRVVVILRGQMERMESRRLCTWGNCYRQQTPLRHGDLLLGQQAVQATTMHCEVWQQKHLATRFPIQSSLTSTLQERGVHGVAAVSIVWSSKSVDACVLRWIHARVGAMGMRVHLDHHPRCSTRVG
jgi:hypothetical protein